MALSQSVASELLEAFLYGLIRGWKDALEDPQAAVDLTMELYGDELGLDADVQLLQHQQAIDLIESADTAENGLFTMIANNSIHTNPPLCITEEQLGEGFEIIDRALDIADQAVT